MSSMLRCLSIAAALALGVCASAPRAAEPGDAAFEKASGEAIQNIGTREGAEYDEALGHYLASQQGYGAAMKQCVAASPGEQNIAGYIAFDAQGAYTIELRPKGAFADCLRHFLEGRQPPKPPRLPYVDPLSFTTKP